MHHAGDRLFVVTGGPGSGKTTLLEAAARDGFGIVPEAGRAIIQLQSAIGGSGLHTGDRHLYAELMLDRDMQQFQDHAGKPGLTLCDRGIPDLVGYARLFDLGEKPHIEAAARRFRYNRTVFLAPPWRAIYANDAERGQDWAEAVATCDAMARTYADVGYDVVELPLADVGARLEMVRARVGLAEMSANDA